jgi:predicted Zn-ribbon and HTH transcriptional regulator
MSQSRDDYKVQLWGYRCLRCGHEWLPHKLRVGELPHIPRVCPQCKSPYWNVPRRNPKDTENVTEGS